MLNHHHEQHKPCETTRGAVEVIDRHGNRATLGSVAFCRIYEDGGPEKPASSKRVVNLPEVVSRFNKDGHESTRPKTMPSMPWMIEQWFNIPVVNAQGRKIGQGSWEPVTGFLNKQQCDLWLLLRKGDGKRYRVRNCTK